MNFITREMPIGTQRILNIVGCIGVVCVNTMINFFLSPYIVEHLGVEINGYITLANNFVSYFTMITNALNSMAGRFMLVELRRGNTKKASEYYTSVLVGDWILSAVLLIPSIVLIVNLDRFIQIGTTDVTDVKILFSILFFNFFFSLCIPKWSNATYSTNRLYLRSIKTAITAIARALTIYVAYRFFTPYAFYVAIAGTVMTFLNTGIEYVFHKQLLRNVKFKWKYYDKKKIITLISSGIWNTINQCGNLLLEGIDILIANIFINPVAAGILSVAKVIPNMLNQITGNVATTFGPLVTYLFADGKMNDLKNETKRDIKLVALIANIPIGITITLGTYFFQLWIPSQDSKMLTVISTLTLFGILISGCGNCINNIFVAVNKLRFNSLVTIFTGIINIFIVYILLSTTDLGVYAIAGTSSCIAYLRILGFSAPYAAKCIGQKWHSFYLTLLISCLNVLIPISCGFIVSSIVKIDSWASFIIAVLVVCILTVVIDYCFWLNKSEKNEVKKIIRREK